MDMQVQLDELVKDSLANIKDITSTKDLYELKVGVLGKSGKLTNILKGLRALSPEQKAEFGKFVNEAKATLEAEFENANNTLKLKEIDEQLIASKIDITIDKPLIAKGAMHPLNIINDKILGFFEKLGFVMVDAPEIDTEYFNFEALNVAGDHPARDMQDTFFVDNGFLLRSHTSNGQVRAMHNIKPPFKVLSPGRVFRADPMDATHSPMFHQIEGIVVAENLTMCDLKGILELFAKFIFGQETKVRFRPSYFPFTEPSVEVDASCMCENGCNICKGTGWIEILGAGMVNKVVLKNGGIDTDKYTGFAFGLGLERITNIVYGIRDMRALFENDVRFLSQFGGII